MLHVHERVERMARGATMIAVKLERRTMKNDRWPTRSKTNMRARICNEIRVCELKMVLEALLIDQILQSAILSIENAFAFSLFTSRAHHWTS